MTLVDADTGEMISAPPAVRPAAPMTIVEVAAQCRSVEVWAEHCDSIDELREADHRLAAIGEYVKRTSTEGRAKVEAARRRLELRIGQLLGAAKVGGGDHGNQHRPSLANDGLTPNERSQFRKMADHPDVVDAVIDDSTDESPASRRRVLDEIGKAKHAPPPPETDAEREARERSEGIDRAVGRLRKALTGWDQLYRLTDNVQRDAILARLEPVERARLAEIEEVIHG